MNSSGSIDLLKILLMHGYVKNSLQKQRNGRMQLSYTYGKSLLVTLILNLKTPKPGC